MTTAYRQPACDGHVRAAERSFEQRQYDAEARRDALRDAESAGSDALLQAVLAHQPEAQMPVSSGLPVIRRWSADVFFGECDAKFRPLLFEAVSHAKHGNPEATMAALVAFADAVILGYGKDNSECWL
jgi:hypothetical protein